MARRVKDYIGISEFTSLGDLIRYLETIRDNLPAGHQAEMRISGDDDSGRRLTINYFREQTAEETALECASLAAGSAGGGGSADLDQLRRQLDSIPYDRSSRSRGR